MGTSLRRIEPDAIAAMKVRLLAFVWCSAQLHSITSTPRQKATCPAIVEAFDFGSG